MKKVYEGLQEQDLRDLIHSEIHIDEYKAKLSDDDEVIVVSFMVKYRSPANDLENFLEKGYDWILDAETSAGEKENGYYVVFLEAQRRTWFPEKFMELLEELKNITNIERYTFKYGAADDRNSPEYEISAENLRTIVPLSPKEYREKLEAKKKEDIQLESMLMSARVPFKIKLYKNKSIKKPR